MSAETRSAMVDIDILCEAHGIGRENGALFYRVGPVAPGVWRWCLLTHGDDVRCWDVVEEHFVAAIAVCMSRPPDDEP